MELNLDYMNLNHDNVVDDDSPGEENTVSLQIPTCSGSMFPRARLARETSLHLGDN